jgi:hypothetical protein
MPAPTDAGRPSAAVAVADRYRRLERPVSGAVALLVAAVVAAAMLSQPLVPGLLAAAGVLVVVRTPLFTTGGSARLVTDATPEAVRADFESATPPMLAFQWGIADVVRSTADGATYELSYLFGLRSVTMDLETRADVDAGDAVDLRLVVTAGGRSWGTYDVTITAGEGDADNGETSPRGDGTVVDVAWTADRRFGLNRLPQWLVAERYRDRALVAQGYTPVDREASLSIAG